MRDRLIELILQTETFTADEAEYARKQAEYKADYLIANNVIMLPYNVHLPKELYRHMFDNDYNKVVVKCKVGKNTGYGFTLVHYLDGREWKYDYKSIGKTVFLTREEAKRALKGGAE